MDKNELRKQPAHIIDIMATCIELAGTEYPEEYKDHKIKSLDGRSLLPIVQQDAKIRDTLFWEHQGNKAVRIGPWKLVSILENKSWELYNMDTDRTETNDLAANHPEKVTAMEQVYNQWAANSNVLPWEEMEISIIPAGKSSYSRTLEEANKAYEEVIKKVESLKNNQ